jgi:hypothetical protein
VCSRSDPSSCSASASVSGVTADVDADNRATAAITAASTEPVTARTSVDTVAETSAHWSARVVPTRRSAAWLQNGAAAIDASALAPSTRPISVGENPRPFNHRTKNGMNPEATNQARANSRRSRRSTSAVSGAGSIAAS